MTTTTAAARTETLLRLEQEFGVLVRRIRRVIGERASAVHPELAPASFLMLSHIADAGPMRASEVASTFHVDKGAISRQVQQLVDLGLIDRVPDPADGRAHLLSASAEALRRIEAMGVSRRSWLDQRLGDWSAEELEEFVNGLARYNSALDA